MSELKRPRARPVQYTAYVFGNGPQIEKRLNIQALSDDEAIADVIGMGLKGRIEVWRRRIHVATFNLG